VRRFHFTIPVLVLAALSLLVAARALTSTRWSASDSPCDGKGTKAVVADKGGRDDAPPDERVALQADQDEEIDDCEGRETPPTDLFGPDRPRPRPRHISGLLLTSRLAAVDASRLLWSSRRRC
jgi:hypothetical protein